LNLDSLKTRLRPSAASEARSRRLAMGRRKLDD
jgi:hypothetical protein